MNRQAIARTLAKALAYRQCGKQREAERWAAELVRLLGCAGILADDLKLKTGCILRPGEGIEQEWREQEARADEWWEAKGHREGAGGAR